MTPEPTPTEAPAQPGNVAPIFNPADGPAPVTPYPGDSVSVPVEGGTPPPPTAEDLEAARKGLEEDMREAVPFNRLAIHTSFQRVIQGAVTEGKDIGKIDRLTSAFRAWAEGESRLAFRAWAECDPSLGAE